MKKLIIGLFCALSLVTAAFAADTNSVTVTAKDTSTSLFNAKEFGLSIGSGYTLDRAALFKQPYSVNLNAGAFFYPWRNLGIEADVPFYETKGVSVQEVQFGPVLRFPLSKDKPILKNLAPYIGAGGIYNWQTTQDWAYYGKVGLEVRVNKHWGVFTEGQYRNSDLKANDGQTSVQGGLRLVF